MGTNPFKTSVTGGTTPAVSRETTDPFRAAEDAEPYNPAEALRNAVGAVQDALGDLDPDNMDQDAVLDVLGVLRVLNNSKSPVREMDTSLKARLWSIIGGKAGEYRSPGGRKFSFRRGAKSRRATNFTALQNSYPDAYKACVTETPVDLSSPASLYL